MKPLARALAALPKRPADALDALIDAWGNAPSHELAELVELASGLVRTSPPEIRGKTKAAIAAWQALARAGRAADIPALLESLTDVLWRDAWRRLSVVQKWRRDPRVDEGLVRMIERLPYASASRPFYLALLDLASRIHDPVLTARIANARDAIGGRMSPTMAEWLERRLANLLRKLAKNAWKPAAFRSPKLRDALVALAKMHAPRADIDDLLRSVYEQPDDIARRLVYADALIERGDPRGELITLQCQPAPTPAQARRASALLKTHGRQWLEDLGSIIAPGWTFERGFLATVRIDSNKGPRLLSLAGHPAWSTVHTLADSALIGLHPVMRSLRTLVFRPNRARSREDYATAWRELLGGTPRPIERLHYTDLDNYEDRDEQIELLGTCPALPKLRELRVGGLACMYAEALLHSPICTRIETLAFVLEPHDDPRTMLGPLRESPVRRVVFEHETLHVIIEGRASAHLDVFARGGRRALDMIEALPPSVRELRVTTPADTSRDALAILTAAARAKPGIEVCEIGPTA